TASAATAPIAALGSGTVSRSHPRFALGPVSARWLSEPDTSEIVPTPFMRESLPVSVNLSGTPFALFALITTRPVVHGKPALVTLFGGTAPVPYGADFATSP